MRRRRPALQAPNEGCRVIAGPYLNDKSSFALSVVAGITYDSRAIRSRAEWNISGHPCTRFFGATLITSSGQKKSFGAVCWSL